MAETGDKQLHGNSPTDKASTDQKRRGDGSGNEGVQGEGNYEAARRFNDAEQSFVESGRVEGAARAAAPKSEAERQQMMAAEQEGKRRAKEEDPSLTKPRPAPATPKARGSAGS